VISTKEPSRANLINPKFLMAKSAEIKIRVQISELREKLGAILMEPTAIGSNQQCESLRHFFLSRPGNVTVGVRNSTIRRPPVPEKRIVKKLCAELAGEAARIGAQ